MEGSRCHHVVSDGQIPGIQLPLSLEKQPDIEPVHSTRTMPIATADCPSWAVVPLLSFKDTVSHKLKSLTKQTVNDIAAFVAYTKLGICPSLNP